MSRVFLGRWQHWVLLLVVCALGWLAGRERLHVTDFNVFVWLTIASAVAMLVLVLATTRPHEQVTRDPIEPDEPPEEAARDRQAAEQRS